jgi:hypothetical protein
MKKTTELTTVNNATVNNEVVVTTTSTDVTTVNNATATDKKSVNNTDKVNRSFTDIERLVSDMVLGTKCGITKYNDNRNGYIGIKVGNKNVFSLYGLKNDNENKKKWCIGLTDKSLEFIRTKYSTNKNITIIENGNSGDKTRNHKLEVSDFKYINELFKYIVKCYV